MGAVLAFARPSVLRASPAPLSLPALAGRLCEVSGAAACISVSMQWVLEAQLGGELAAWVQVGPSGFFPPDVAATGVDLGAFPIASVASPIQAARAAEQLLRSGGFALVVIDTVGSPAGGWQMAVQSRLLGLAQKHSSAVVFLNDKRAEEPSLGSLVSLRLHTRQQKREGDRFVVECEVLKDKRLGPGATVQQVFLGPAGVG